MLTAGVPKSEGPGSAGPDKLGDNCKGEVCGALAVDVS
jgi:hypothetical protein